MADPMPSTYETQTTTTTSHSSGVALNTSYITSKEGILRIVEIVLGLILLICAAVGWRMGGYSSWCQFVGAWCFVTILIWFILYLLGLNVRLPGPAVLIELIYFAVMALFCFIAGIVAAVVGSYPAMGAASFFAFALMVVLIVDCFFLFQLFRSGVTSATMTTSSNTTTTTVTTEKETY